MSSVNSISVLLPSTCLGQNCRHLTQRRIAVESGQLTARPLSFAEGLTACRELRRRVA